MNSQPSTGRNPSAIDDPASAPDYLAWTRTFTAICAEGAFVALFAWILWQTWTAPTGKPPSIGGARENAAGALAVAFGAAYAWALRVQPANEAVRTLSDRMEKVRVFLKRYFGEKPILSLGALLYLLVGVATTVTYVVNEGEAPGIVRNIGVGFLGYVVAYLGSAYRQ
jgi:hypothetical protein